MTIHGEGYKTIALCTLIVVLLNLSVFWFFGSYAMWFCIIFLVITLGMKRPESVMSVSTEIIS